MNSIKGKKSKSVEAKRYQRLMYLLNAPDTQRFKSFRSAKPRPSLPKEPTPE